MATGHEWIFQSASVLWIITLLLSESQSKKTQIYYMQDNDCGQTIRLGGATVFSHKNTNTHNYPHNVGCQLTFQAVKNWKFMMRITSMDIPDITDRGICNDALYVYNDKNIYTGAMNEAGGNNGLCGTYRPRAINSTGVYLTIYFRTNKDGPTGRGFAFIMTAFSEEYRKSNSCGMNFQCDNHLCIDKQLTCDGVDHCGDGSDELGAGRSKCRLDPEYRHHNTCDVEHDSPKKDIFDKFLSLGVTASVAITVGSLVVIVMVVVAVVCCCRRSSCRKSQDSQGSVTSTGSAVIVNGASAPYHQGQTPIHAFTPNSSCHHGYYPMQPVYPSPYPSSVYSPSSQPRESYSHSSHPPSYHRSHTPTSSKSGKSIRSGNSLPYSQGTEKVTLPVNL